MLLLVVYTFSYGVYGPASGTGTELHNASVAVVDEDHSQLSERINNALLPPIFQRPKAISLIGAGVPANPSNFILFEKLISVVHEHAPRAKICFNTMPSDTAAAVKRWL